MYIDLDINYNLSFADTASGEALTRRAAEFGVNRRAATKAIRLGEFYAANHVPMDVPIGSRFSIESVNYAVISKISTGVYRLECETPGGIGNQFYGALLPIQFINGLARAELGAVLVPGEDEETDEELRQRYFETVNEPAFGGNVADYKQKINAIDGVGGVKVYPTWNGGGTVKCTIIASDWNAPSTQLTSDVQQLIDPVPQGQGLGQAPIGHLVTITGVEPVTIDVETTVTLEAGVTIGQVRESIEQAVEAYLLGLRRYWAHETQLVVRISQIESAILAVPGVIDVEDTELNGSAANIMLGEEEVPMLGSVTVHV
jgi:uncharacterized phage protein gp47/JayE